MGLEKNFVVKKGIEVATDLLFADTPTNRVGVGTTQPSRKLDVNGDFQAVGDSTIIGISTVHGVLDIGVGGTALRVNTGTKRIGINTDIPGYNLDVVGDVGLSTNLNVGGITTSSIVHVTGVTSTTDLNVLGVGTISDVRIEAGFTTVTYSEAQYLNVTGVGTFAQFDATNVDISGISTINLLNVTGVSTFNSDVGIQTTLSFIDDAKVRFGTGNDLEIYHDGTNSYISDTGDGYLILQSNRFEVTNATGNESIINVVEDGGVELYYDNVKKLETATTGVTVTGTLDSTVITAGVVTSIGAMTVTGDLFANSFRGDGSNLTGIDTSGNFSGKTIIAENLYVPSTSGITTVGSIVINNPAGTISATDLVVTNVSASSSVTAVEFYGDGTNITNTGSILNGSSGTQRVILSDLTSGRMLTAATDPQLTFDASTDTLSCTNFSGNGSSISNVNAVTVDGIDSSQFIRSDTADIKTSGNLRFNDNVGATFGNGDDLLIYHDSNNSFIKDQGSGRITIQTNQLQVTNHTDSEVMIKATEDGSVMLYHDGNQKFKTTSAGVTVTGTLTATTFSGSGASLNSIPNGALNNSTISGQSLGTDLATISAGSYITGSGFNGSTARTWSVDATSGNSGGKVVARDSTGNFSAATITAELNGTALRSTNIRVDAEESTNASRYITFTGGQTADQRIYGDSGLRYNPSTNTITASTFNGNATTASNASNAGLLDGYNSSISSAANTVAVRDGNSDLTINQLHCSYINCSHGPSTRNSDQYFLSDSGNGWMYRNTRDGMRTSLNVPSRTGSGASGTWGINISGTAAVASNSSALNGYASSTGANANTIALRDGSGHLTVNYSYCQWINARSSNSDSSGANGMVMSSSDGWYRHYNSSNVRAFLDVPTRTGGSASGTWGINISGNAASSSTCTVNNSNANSSYNIVWNSGNTLYYTNSIYLNPSSKTIYANNFNSTSDIRVKDNIKTLEGSLDKLNLIRGVEYDRNDSEERFHQLGVIAQEIEKVYPEAVDEDKNGMKTVSYQQLVPVLIEAVKELSQEVKNLKGIIDN